MNTALIFAAGRGERLRPLTNHLPKALCVVHGKPLIEHQIAALAAAGFTRIIINHAYLGDQIKRYLGNGTRFNVEIIYSPEPPGALETAGAIINALPYINSSHFVTVSADIYTAFNYSTLRAPSDVYLAHIILVPIKPEHQHGDFALTSKQLVQNSPPHYLFGNIACFSRQAFATRPLDRYSITQLLRTWATNQQLSGELYVGAWFDTGTPARLALARCH